MKQIKHLFIALAIAFVGVISLSGTAHAATCGAGHWNGDYPKHVGGTTQTFVVCSSGALGYPYVSTTGTVDQVCLMKWNYSTERWVAYTCSSVVAGSSITYATAGYVAGTYATRLHGSAGYLWSAEATI